MKQPPALTPYTFTDEIERAVVVAECTEPSFHAAVGAMIEPERMRSSPARLLVAAAHAVASQVGRGPTNVRAPVQHLFTLMSLGKLTLDQFQACQDYLLDVDILDLDAIAELRAVVSPIVGRVMHKDLVILNQDLYKNNASLDSLVEQAHKIQRIGKATRDAGGSLEQIIARPEYESPRQFLPSGITELDTVLGGGLEQGALGLFVGGSGAGKSMTLGHATVEALLWGHDVMFITLEVSEIIVVKRLMANLTDMTQQEMSLAPEEYRQRLRLLKEAGLGKVVVKWLDPGASGPEDVRIKIREAQDQHVGFAPKVFVIDFMDKMRVNTKLSVYEDAGLVTEGLRQLAVDSNGWTWTASQATRKSTGSPWGDLDAIADSMNKVRGADIVIVIGRSAEDKKEEMVRFNIPKRREGAGANQRIGPIPWDPEHGRVCVVQRTFPW